MAPKSSIKEGKEVKKRQRKEEETDGEPKKPKYVISESDHWKLYKPETLIILKLCYSCIKINQNRQDKFHKVHDDEFITEYQMCKSCYEGNVVRSNDHYKYFPYIKAE